MEYLEHQATRLSDSETTRYNLIVLARHFGALPVASIGEREVESFMLARRVEKKSGGTINRQRATGSGLMQFAIRRGYCGGPNPFRAVPALRESGGRTPYYRMEEMQRLIDAASAHLKPILYAALTTMGRRRELLTLRWDDVDLAHRFIRFRRENTKSKRERLVPICDGLLALLQSLSPGAPDSIVFTWKGRPVRTVTSAFKRARRRAELPGLRFHDLRHVGSCWFLENGGTLEELRQILGHSTFALTQRYGRFSKDYLSTLAEHIGPPTFTVKHH